jgi:hypothetical protein
MRFKVVDAAVMTTGGPANGASVASGVSMNGAAIEMTLEVPTFQKSNLPVPLNED